jgi:hypothetical protein
MFDASLEGDELKRSSHKKKRNFAKSIEGTDVISDLSAL